MESAKKHVLNTMNQTVVCFAVFGHNYNFECLLCRNNISGNPGNSSADSTHIDTEDQNCHRSHKRKQQVSFIVRLYEPAHEIMVFIT